MAIKLRSAKFLNAPLLKVRSVSAAYTVDLNSDYLILPNTTAASRTITLPPIADAYDALSQTGRQYIIQKPIAANSIVIEGNAAETINGAANQTLTTQYSSAILVAGPTEWIMYATDLIDAATLGAGSITGTMILDGTIEVADMAANSIDSDQYVDGSIDPEHFAAGAVDATALGTGAVTPIKILDTAVTPAADAACAILNTTTEINVTVTGAGNVAISTSSSVAGQKIAIQAVAVAGGGSYTLACVVGTLTFNSTGETAYVKRNQANTGWRVLSMTSNAVGGSPATLV
jgi:hypothetical protein